MTQVESQRAIQHRAEVLSSLLKIEAFQVLEEELKKKSLRMGDALLETLLATDVSPQRLLDEHRGFVAGMRYAMAVPRGAHRNLQGEVEEEEEPDVADGWATWAR